MNLQLPDTPSVAARSSAFATYSGEISMPTTLNPLLANGVKCLPMPHAKSKTRPFSGTSNSPKMLFSYVTSSSAFSSRPNSSGMNSSGFSMNVSSVQCLVDAITSHEATWSL